MLLQKSRQGNICNLIGIDLAAENCCPNRLQDHIPGIR